MRNSLHLIDLTDFQRFSHLNNTVVLTISEYNLQT